MGMDIDRVRRLLRQGTITLRFTDHALIEARKDGLTVDDLEEGIHGEVIEDYDVRALLLSFTQDDGLPYHIVVEYVLRLREATIVTAYIPDSEEWESNWKRRKRRKRR